MAHRLDDLVQRGHAYAIVDEVDSILVDEARTPLIISGPANEASEWYAEFARLAELMEADTHYEVDVRKRTIGVHEEGVEFRRGPAGHRQPLRGRQFAAGRLPQQCGAGQGAVRLRQGLHRPRRRGADRRRVHRPGTARAPLQRGLASGHRAKEAVEIKAENQTLATITLQNHFRLYGKLAPRTLLCGSAWRVAISIAGAPFGELREAMRRDGRQSVAGGWYGRACHGTNDRWPIARGFPALGFEGHMKWAEAMP